MGKTPSILFSISDTGGGHRAGATAIDAALEQLVGPSVQRHIVDMLTSTGTPFIRNAPDLYDQLSTRWLPFYDFLYRATDGRRRIELITHLVYLQAHRNVVRVLNETRPDLVISVHPLSNRLIANARRSYRLSFRFMTVVTDLVSLHAAWADPDVDLCAVPTDEAYERQAENGLSLSKIARTGFPVHPKFATYSATKHESRAMLGIAQDPFTVLITSGGVGSGSVRDIVLELEQAYPQHQLLVVTGKNATLREELQALRLGPNVWIYGFVGNMEVLMAASDIIVSKAGPGTLMESLVMRRPVIVTEAVGMQEQGNIDFVLNHELGVFAPTPDRMVPAVAELMDPQMYAATVARLEHAVPREGATQIAQLALDQLHLGPAPRRRILQPTMTALRSFGERRLKSPALRMQTRLRSSTARFRLRRTRPHERWRRRWGRH